MAATAQDDTRMNIQQLIGIFCCIAVTMTGGQALGQQAPSKATAPIRDPAHRYQIQVKSWLKLKTEGIVMQQRDYSCGAAALATLFQYHWGDKITETQILNEVVQMLTPEEMKDRIEKGLSLTDLRRVALRFGYLATIGTIKIEDLYESKIPLIAGIVVDEYDHFVVIRGIDHQYVYLGDSARGKIRVPIAEFQQQWQKNAVLVVVKQGATNPENSPLRTLDEEKKLGITNQYYLRDQTTTIAPILVR
jgi:predicted double-glycine peptidase